MLSRTDEYMFNSMLVQYYGDIILWDIYGSYDCFEENILQQNIKIG